MTLFLMLITKLDAPLIEEALTKYADTSKHKTFGLAHVYWEKVAEGIYLVVNDYMTQNRIGDEKLRSGLQEGLRKRDKTGEVIWIQTKKRLEVEKNEGTVRN